MKDEAYMELALRLAEKGCGWVSPNPMVGAVIVKNDRIIGQGYHERYGELHAERNALASLTESPRGATMYVTLEPCCHYGKQPPCVEAILEAGIRRVVVGSEDPNPLVSGKGIRLLREQGVLVTEHVKKEACDRQNEVFFHYIRTKLPYVVLKYAMTMDGKIAAHTGLSKWVTGEAARAHVQQQRHRYTGIMVGVGTVLKDDPLLTCRLAEIEAMPLKDSQKSRTLSEMGEDVPIAGKNPIRIICDSGLRTPLSAQVVTTAGKIPTILATCCEERSRHRPYQEAGCRILVTDQKAGRVDLGKLMAQLGQEQIDSILLEGGGTLNWSALEAGIVKKVQAYIAPKFFGGESARTPVEGRGVASPSEAVLLKNSVITRLGEDILVESEVV